ncbi:myb-related transcription factor, partner of profilin [Sorex fumeus]|uniref:myb-related transcription factor, partner of profilin n=1 Tax=Sorex fumeus TaxID=62283 RepID=UPI0024ADF4F8|nr:myb-related transcription factor, partner of profilin [Sorex fumeus]
MASAAAGEAEETTRLRKPRFSFEENQILIREVRAHYPQLYGAQSRRVSVAERRRVWDGIAAKINGITSWKRTGQEVQKRWNDFKRRTKEKLARVPHSTQGAGPAADEAFSAEEETIFAILGPGLAGPGAGAGTEPPPPPAAAASQPAAPSACVPRSTCSEDRRAERRADTPAHSKGGSRSPDPWVRPAARPHEGVCLPVKERETPPPAPTQGPPTAGLPAPSPPPPAAPSAPDPALDLLRAQQETADAIRELAGTLRQGLAKLSEALSALLPLLPGAPGDPPPPPPPPPPPRPPPPAPVPKVEMTPEPVSVVAAVVDGAVVAARGVIVSPRSEEGGARPPLAPLPPPDSPPHKRRKGFPTRKRRGRWKAP